MSTSYMIPTYRRENGPVFATIARVRSYTSYKMVKKKRKYFQ